MPQIPNRLIASSVGMAIPRDTNMDFSEHHSFGK